MRLLQALCSKSSDDRNLLCELRQEVFLALCKLFEFLQFKCGLAESTLTTCHCGKELLESLLNLISAQLINRGAIPVLIVLGDIFKSFPELLVRLDRLLAA